MKNSILKNSFTGFAATFVAVSLGYFASQHFEKYMMLFIGTGMFGLGIAVHQTQKLQNQQSLPQTLVVIEPKTELVRSNKQLKRQDEDLINKSNTMTISCFTTSASISVINQVKDTKIISKSGACGYCRKRLALCHQARIKNSNK
ncbi:hypothetical protein [Nostoc sp. MS1]|uniref:hypothetical protein n=1 Tax=Nostoc sp. MS1 TaxID=2764711 RepID=UPI001CC70953|nr:hypothetical protein [Nostoc sp. MS1]BCL33580.1 hypothetical protein NSMS1_00270 [Nostoc sp. MS1]